MWLAFYNPVGIGDVLLLTSGPLDDDHVQTQTEGPITLVKDQESGQVVSINIFGQAQALNLSGQGQIFLDQDQVEKLHALLKANGLDMSLEFDASPKFVVGHVQSCKAHEDSDHLSVTQINVGNDRVEQIVCGARNIRQGLNVLVALPGAVMPSGQIIWPGSLRGVSSNGMVCSTRELGLTHIEDLPGIWELKANLEPGTPLDQVVAAYQA